MTTALHARSPPLNNLRIVLVGTVVSSSTLAIPDRSHVSNDAHTRPTHQSKGRERSSDGIRGQEGAISWTLADSSDTSAEQTNANSLVC